MGQSDGRDVAGSGRSLICGTADGLSKEMPRDGWLLCQSESRNALCTGECSEARQQAADTDVWVIIMIERWLRYTEK